MSITKTIFILAFLLGFKAQPDFDSFVKYKTAIDSKIQKNIFTKKTIEKMTRMRGVLEVRSDASKLVFVSWHDEKEYGSQTYNFYIKNDTLILVTQKLYHAKEPEENEIGVYKKKYFKNNKIDFSKAPLIVAFDNVYYFKNNEIIKSYLKNFNKPKQEDPAQIQLANNAILEYYKLIRQELK